MEKVYHSKYEFITKKSLVAILKDISDDAVIIIHEPARDYSGDEIASFIVVDIDTDIRRTTVTLKSYDGYCDPSCIHIDNKESTLT